MIEHVYHLLELTRQSIGLIIFVCFIATALKTLTKGQNP